MGELSIKWLGHSCVLLEEGDFRIVIDPFKDDYVPGYRNIREEADLVLMTHGHADHSAAEVVTIRPESPERANPFTITEVHSFHDPEGGAKRGTNTIFILDDGEYRIVHMGDVGCEPTEEQKALLANADVMLIPVGGFYTMEPDLIRKLVEELRPVVTVPMHYRSETFGYPVLHELSDYTGLCDDVVIYDTDTLHLPEDGAPQTAVLAYGE